MTVTPGMPATPLVVAAHGTRDPDGVAACEALVDRIRGMLPGVAVHLGYVELVEPPVETALITALTEQVDAGLEPHAVVVPLMVGTGNHVRKDIPASVAAACDAVPGARVGYGRAIGADPLLLGAVQSRIEQATVGDPGEGVAGDPRDLSVVLVGRGAAVADANADHARLARLLYERAGYAQVAPAYAQVTRPSIPEALGMLAASGAKNLVVAPCYLLPGLLRTWTRQQVEAWAATHPDVRVRLAEVLGDCPELATIVVERYREAADDPPAEEGSPVYLTGLALRGRDVLVVGAGHVADRRVPRLLAAGARVRLVSPTISVSLRRRLGEGLVWEQRGFDEGDVDGAWFVMALTNDPAVNAAVTASAHERRVFCVRADAAREGSAWTPAVAGSGGLTVGVVGNRDPRRSVAVRDALLRILHG